MNVCTCGSPSETSFSHLGPLCKACFVDVIHRRVRKAIKDFGWLQPGDKVHVAEDRTAQGKAVPVLLREVVKGLPLDHVPAGQARILIVGRTADDEAEQFLEELFAGEMKAMPKELNLLQNVSTEEIGQYCTFQHIVGEPHQESVLRQRLEGLEKRYPGTLFSLQKSQHAFRKTSE